MSAPTIVSVNPIDAESDVVLGSQIVVTFDQPIDTTTVNASTFSLTGPGQTGILTPEQMITAAPSILHGREYIMGAFTFTQPGAGTVVTFNPSVPLQPNLPYQVTVAGIDGVLSSDGIKNLGAEGMAQTFRWGFITGDLNVSTPPLASPLPSQVGRIEPTSIVVKPRQVIGNDLTQEIDIIFPGPIDPGSFSLSDLLISIEAFLGDPLVSVPSGLTAVGAVSGNILKISITGW